ncbi:hypothetical protein L596_023784 [Steinernema carpocapsae]|uniref:Uncharacterized protein n=1 Tax=Steinernema carpocapsae TaxID=34508 RepID=A0A4U5MEQ3_STECR|nr:hypothetical protein L596_023784 [Steinernema carpocapsae]
MKPLLNDRAAMTFHGAPPDAKFIVVDGGSGSVAESSARGYERNAISHELSTYLGVNSPYHWSSSLDSSDISSCNYTVSERDSDTMMLDCSLEDANRMSEKRIRRRKTVTDRFARSAGAEFCRRVQRRRESIDGAGPNRHNKTLFPARFRNLDCSGDPVSRTTRTTSTWIARRPPTSITRESRRHSREQNAKRRRIKDSRDFYAA